VAESKLFTLLHAPSIPVAFQKSFTPYVTGTLGSATYVLQMLALLVLKDAGKSVPPVTVSCV
jgi:hypothetical protein